jgi:PIN domain nuclease of toxin-antitoxin system
MSVLDAQAIVAFLIDEPAAQEVRDLLHATASISAVNWVEVIDRLVRTGGRNVDHVMQRLDLLIAGGLKVVAVDEVIGRVAGRLRAQHYHRRERPISHADCVALATAEALREPLATSDPALVTTAAAIGVTVIPLPDSHGRRPRLSRAG